MRIKHYRSLTVAAVTIGLLGLTSSSAMAAVANWSDTTHGFKVSGTLTAYKNGGTPKTCTISAAPTISSAGASGFFLEWTTPFGAVSPAVQSATCSGGGRLGMRVIGTATWNGSVYEATFNGDSSACCGFADSPFGGSWKQDNNYTLTFVNAAGGTPSHVVYSSTQNLGVLTGGVLSLSGTLDITTSTGAALTLSH